MTGQLIWLFQQIKFKVKKGEKEDRGVPQLKRNLREISPPPPPNKKEKKGQAKLECQGCMIKMKKRWSETSGQQLFLKKKGCNWKETMWKVARVVTKCLSIDLLLLQLSRFSRVRHCATPWMAAHQAPPSLGFSRQEHWNGLPFPSLMHESEK